MAKTVHITHPGGSFVPIAVELRCRCAGVIFRFSTSLSNKKSFVSPLIHGGNVSKRPSFISRFSTKSDRNKTTTIKTVSAEEGLSCRAPLLLLPRGFVVNDDGKYELDSKSGSKETGEDYYHFYNVAKNKVSRIRKNLRLPWQREHLLPSQEICLGSSHGWLAFIHPFNCSLYLYNPFIDYSGGGFPYLPLPPVETLSQVHAGYRSLSNSSGQIHTEYDCRNGDKKLIPPLELSKMFGKVVLSSSSLSPFPFNNFPFSSSIHHKGRQYYSDNNNKEQSDDCVVMAIIGTSRNSSRLISPSLVCCRVGDSAWTLLVEQVYDYDYIDLVYSNKHQKFYVYDGLGGIYGWDFSDMASPKRTHIIESDPPKHDEAYSSYDSKKYLVESSEDLLLVERHYKVEEHYKTDLCVVHKLNVSKKKWDYVSNLGDQVLFVGTNQSFSVSALQFPGLKPNSIYFSSDLTMDWDNELHQTHDVGIFDMEDKTITPLFDCQPNTKLSPFPLWIMPLDEHKTYY